jgi:hypothetical protein
MAALLQLQHYALAAHTQEAYQPLVFVRSKFSSASWLAVAANQQLLAAVPRPPARGAGAAADAMALH